MLVEVGGYEGDVEDVSCCWLDVSEDSMEEHSVKEGFVSTSF